MAVSLTSRGFEKIDEEAGVSVFKQPDAENVRVAAEARLQIAPRDLLAVLLDYEAQRGAIDSMRESEVLQREPRRLLVYQRLDLPVIDDRDYVLLVTWGADGDDYWIRYEVSTGHDRPEVDGVVRVPFHSGSWQLKATQGGAATWVRLQSSIDIAGWVPKWLAKSAAGDELPNLFKDICSLVESGREDGRPCL